MARRFLGFLIALQLPLFGCSKSAVVIAEPSEGPTFHRDVAPILFDHCASCHRAGGAAPFGLVTYDNARDRAGQIAEVTTSRFMPPWLPEEGHEELVGNRRLNDVEIKRLAAWVAAGAPEGEPKDSPPVPKFASGWQLGEPDLVLESPAFELSAGGPNRFRNFVLPVPGDEDRWVRAVELRPVNPQTTHHARLGIDTNNESVRRDAADDEVGYEGMAWGQDPPGQLITWTPGMTADAGTSGAAWRLTSGAALVLHAHLQPSGKPERVRFRLGFYYTDAAPTVHPLIMRIGSRDIDIPAGQSRHQISDFFVLPVDVDVHSVFPHAHSLCREILVQAHTSKGAPKTLIAIRRFDENWHDTYRFARSVRLPQGTRLITRFTYDNTSANVCNPNIPPQRVVYGSNADDEMSDVYLQVTPVDPAQYAALEEHYNQTELKSKIVGYRKSLELHADDPWSVEGLASCYVADGQSDEAMRLLEARPQLLQASIQANVILGMAYLATGNAEASEQRLRQSLTKDERFALAWLGLGQALVAKSHGEEAEQAFRKAIELAPRLTVARLDLVDQLIKRERLDEAATLCTEAIKSAPAEYKPHLKLANILAQQKQYDTSLKHFAAARELAPFLYSPESSLAIACYQFGDEQTANRLLQEALATDPDDPVPHCFLGQIARRDSHWREARDHLQRASELPTPHSWPASHKRQFLTLVYKEQLQLAEQLQDAELARQAATAWIRLEPNNATLRDLLRQID